MLESGPPMWIVVGVVAPGSSRSVSVISTDGAAPVTEIAAETSTPPRPKPDESGGPPRVNDVDTRIGEPAARAKCSATGCTVEPDFLPVRYRGTTKSLWVAGPVVANDTASPTST